ncbi:MAG: MBL fold metallo-hydrolase, partial [Candidatus Entotheonellia bacterium]
TEVYPGHYAGSVCGQGMDGKPVTTIGRERRFNPTFQLSHEAFVSKIAERMLPFPADFHAVKRRNMGWQ